MKTLLAVFQLFPVLLAAVRAVEEAIPLPGQGKKKLDLVLEILKSAYDAATDLKRDFSFEKLAAIAIPMIGRIVALYNELGLFQHGPAEATK